MAVWDQISSNSLQQLPQQNRNLTFQIIAEVFSWKLTHLGRKQSWGFVSYLITMAWLHNWQKIWFTILSSSTSTFSWLPLHVACLTIGFLNQIKKSLLRWAQDAKNTKELYQDEYLPSWMFRVSSSCKFSNNLNIRLLTTILAAVTAEMSLQLPNMLC